MGKKVQRAGINNCQKRVEQAETRTELAKTRAEQAETRTEQAETILQHVVRKEVYLRPEISMRPIKRLPLNALADQKSPLEKLTSRQREILQLKQRLARLRVEEKPPGSLRTR